MYIRISVRTRFGPAGMQATKRKKHKKNLVFSEKRRTFAIKFAKLLMQHCTNKC